MAQLTSTATVTGKTGGGPSTVTSLAIAGILAYHFSIVNGVLQIDTAARQYFFDLTQTTVVTDTISGVAHTFVVS